MIGKKPPDEIVKFKVNGIECFCDGVIVWIKKQDGTEVDIGGFEDIRLLETTSHCAIFYSECLNEYLAFDGDVFFNVSKIHFNIVPEHKVDMPQLEVMWEQVLPIIDDEDILNSIDRKNVSYHNWGIESSCFLIQKDEFYKGTLLIGICGCTCQGDDDILAEVDASDNYVSWKIFHQRDPKNFAIYVFEKGQYKDALTKAIADITKKAEDIHDWAWLLSYSKEELFETINQTQEKQMNFVLTIGIESRDIENPTVRDVNIAIDSLNPDNEDSFIVLDSLYGKKEFSYLQVIYYQNYSNKKLQYTVEFRAGAAENFKHYKKITENKTEIKKYFEDFLLTEKLPAPDNWEDITSELLYRFDVFKLAEKYHRDELNIIDCHEFYHGFELKESIIYQYIAEAIILCKNILESGGSCGEIYFTEDRKRFYIDITIPKKWQNLIPIVYRIQGMLSANTIYITCYDKDGNFLHTPINPLPQSERLLACFLLIFTEKILTNDDYLITVLNYYNSPDKNAFESIYTDFMENKIFSDYFIIYEEAGYFDFCKYEPLSAIYNAYMENILQSSTYKNNLKTK